MTQGRTSHRGDLRLDLELVLPDLLGHEADDCERRLVDILDATAGVSGVHIDHEPDGAPVLCVHLAPGVTDVGQIRDRVRAAGADLSARYGHAIWTVAGTLHATRADALSALLLRQDGVLAAVVSPAGIVRVEFDRRGTDQSKLQAVLRREGVHSAPSEPTRAIDAPLPLTADSRQAPSERKDEDHAEHGDHEHGLLTERGELVMALVGMAIYVPARLLDWFADMPTVVTAMYIAAFVITGVVVGRDTLTSLRARKFEIDLLMLVAAIGAAALGHWSDAALLLVLFSLGHSLEGYAMGRAQRAIEGLAELAPETAQRRTADTVTEVPVAELAVGDVIVVRPNERLAADGIVVAGSTTVDQAPVTGESVPVDKTAFIDADRALDNPAAMVPLHQVFAGTLNGAGAIDVVVTRPASDSTLSRVVKLLNEAETQISPTQKLTNTIERIFVPAVLALVAILIVSPVVTGEAFSDSLNRALAVLVAASPCALAIATPSAVLAAVARAARSGVLVKGGGALEDLARVTVIAFDKTGTLTEGNPKLTDVAPADNIAETELLAVTIAVERTSDHPLARALTGGASDRLGNTPVPTATDVTAVMGKGVTATIATESVLIGNAALFEANGVAIPSAVAAAKDELEEQGRTTMIVRLGERFLGVLGVMDTPRLEAVDAIQSLRAVGIDRMVMLSGDNQRVADAVAAQVGVGFARGDLMPEDKVSEIAALRLRHGRVGMVGDGVNDAPAMASASVGIAMGAAGSDVALETADVALMADDLTALPFAVDLSRRSSRIIKQNLWASLGIVALLIPATVLGLGIGPAVLIHEGSTLIVVVNALRLLATPIRPLAPLNNPHVR